MERISNENNVNRVVIKHKDGSFAEYFQFKKSLVREGRKVKAGQPIAIKNSLNVFGLAVYFEDKNKLKHRIGNGYSHIVPVFHTLNAGDVKLEDNVAYIGKEKVLEVKKEK